MGGSDVLYCCTTNGQMGQVYNNTKYVHHHHLASNIEQLHSCPCRILLSKLCR